MPDRAHPPPNPPRRVQIVGGPRDGEFVDNVGPRLREPVPAPIRIREPGPLPPPDVEFTEREYELRRWCDKRGVVGWRYVLRDVDLGQQG